MLIESIGMFHSGTTAWAEGADGYSPNVLDLTVLAPTIQNTGDLVWWIQASSTGTSDNDIYQFILRGGTGISTDLNAGVVDLVTSPEWLANSAFMRRTDPTGGFWCVTVPNTAMIRYWQVYLQFTTGAGAADMAVFSGLALRSSLPLRVGNIAQDSGITLP